MPDKHIRCLNCGGIFDVSNTNIDITWLFAHKENFCNKEGQRRVLT